jgi:NADPH:quinone reductase-like Zn-dependent oxidoreductase
VDYAVSRERDDMIVMRAACVRRYGGPEQVQVLEVPKPAPRRGEVLIRVVTTTVNSADWRIRSLEVPRGLRTLMRLAMGLSGPRQPILGTELAGVVEEVGAGVTAFRSGDAVIAMPGGSMGAHAEFKAMAANDKVIAKPPSLSFSEAAALCFGGLTALHYLRAMARLRRGERLLVIGAAGTVGTAALQLARVLGAETTAVCRAENAPLVERLGASRVVDYTREDFTAGADAYDVVLDCVGATSYGAIRRSLRPGGRFLRAVADLPGLLLAPFQGRLSGHRVVAGMSTERTADMRYLAELASDGHYRPVIDSTFPLDRIAAAHARVDSRRKRGSVVIEVSPEVVAASEAGDSREA